MALVFYQRISTFNGIENVVGKGRNADIHYLLPFPQHCLHYQTHISFFDLSLSFSSANAVNMDM